MIKYQPLISKLAIAYFMIGFFFALSFALYYRWPPLSFLSPGYYMVIISWPFQAPGFVQDLFNYGLSGKPV